MDKIIVLVLTIAVTLGLFSFSVLGEAANARDLVAFVEEEQTEVQVLLNNPSIVTAQYVYDYYNRFSGTYTVNVFSALAEELTGDSIFGCDYYTVAKDFDIDGSCTVTFTEYTS